MTNTDQARAAAVCPSPAELEQIADDISLAVANVNDLSRSEWDALCYRAVFLAAWDAHARPIVLPIRGGGFNR